MFQSTHKIILSNNNSSVVFPIYISSRSIILYCRGLIHSLKKLAFWACLTFTLVIQLNILSAQNISLDRQTQEIPSYFFKDVDNNLSIDDILGGDFVFKPITDGSIDDLDASYWIQLDFEDELDTLATQKLWRLRTTIFSEATLYYLSENSIKQKSFGQFNNSNKNSSFVYSNGVPFENKNLISGRYLYVKIQTYFRFSRTLQFSYLCHDSNRFYTEYYSEQDIKKLTPSLFYLGACSIIFLTFLVIYLNTKKPEFLFYALYVFFSAIYLSGYNIPVLHSFFESKIGFWIIIVSQILINLFYLIFAKLYLDTSKYYPLLNGIIKMVVLVLLLLISSHVFTYFFAFYEAQENILDFQRGLMTLFGVFSMIYLLYKPKDMLVIFIVMGSFIYMVGALGYLFTVNKHYMMVGSILEILVFSLGLAYKIKLDYEDKLDLQKEVSAKEISAKSAQMNPHFIFNSLNSIQHLILKNDKVSALTYLSKFGKLTRNVLESSHMATVTLAEEISLLKSYLELESLRFDNSFEYLIEIDQNIETENVEVPLMLIQPFVENALIHGLIGKKTGVKKLTLRFLKDDDFYVIQIEDNGIGRHSLQNASGKIQQKSRGMEITEKRLKMLNTQEQNKNSVEIIDKYDSNGQPSGTKVIIRIHNP